MTVVLYALAGLLAGMLINRAADCWLSPAPLACGLTRHPRRQWLVVVLMPALFAGLAAWRDDPRATAITCLLCAVLALLAVVDVEQRRLPNVVVLPAIILAVALSSDRWAAVLAAGVGFIVFLVFYEYGYRRYGPGALGVGDVKLAALIGAAVGWPAIGFALALGVGMAGMAAVGKILTLPDGRNATLPYGFYMAVGGVIVLLSGL